MKNIKKFLGVFISILFSFFSVNFVFAENTVISSDNITADVGTTVTFPIKISGNTNGVSTFGIKINFDSSAMTPKSDITNGVYTGDIIFNPSYKGVSGQAFATGASSSNKKGDGALFYIDFEINANATKGKKYPVSIEVDELKYISNAKTIDIVNTVTNGSITINGSSSESGSTDTSSETKIYCGAVIGKAGETINLPINISGNTNGISTFGIKINYDSSVLTPESEVVNGIYTSDIIFNPTYKGVSGQAFATGASSSNKKGDGTLFSVPFKISSNAVSGKTYTVTIEVDELKYVSNATTVSVNYTTSNGTVTVGNSSSGSSGNTGNENTSNYKYGDVNGDGAITAEDASLVLQKALNSSFKFPIEK